METSNALQVQRTADGSWTASFGGEAMHSAQGALGETAHVYGEAIEYVVKNGFPLSFLSVGFGLGYLELWIAAVTAKHAPGFPVFIESFEERTELYTSFLDWLSQRPTQFAPVYEETLKSISDLQNVSPSTVVGGLRRWADSNQWKRSGKISPPDRKFSCILYDPFSAGSSPALWEKGFLSEFILQAAKDECVFATYASTSPLKAALKDHGFRLRDKSGFGGKRESTLAVRA